MVNTTENVSTCNNVNNITNSQLDGDDLYSVSYIIFNNSQIKKLSSLYLIDNLVNTSENVSTCNNVNNIHNSHLNGDDLYSISHIIFNNSQSNSHSLNYNSFPKSAKNSFVIVEIKK